MDVEIIDEEENPMLHRTDVRFQLTHDEATPSRLSVRDSLAAKLNKGSDEVVVHKLDTKYGMRKTVGYAKVYDTADAARDVEQDHTLARNKITEDGAEPEPEPEPEAEEEPEVEEESEAEEADEDEAAEDEAAEDEAEAEEAEEEAEAEPEAEEEAEADEEEAEAEADEEETDADDEPEDDEAEAEAEEA